jgi:hypothetical protein
MRSVPPSEPHGTSGEGYGDAVDVAVSRLGEGVDALDAREAAARLGDVERAIRKLEAVAVSIVASSDRRERLREITRPRSPGRSVAPQWAVTIVRHFRPSQSGPKPCVRQSVPVKSDEPPGPRILSAARSWLVAAGSAA